VVLEVHGVNYSVLGAIAERAANKKTSGYVNREKETIKDIL